MIVDVEDVHVMRLMQEVGGGWYERWQIRGKIRRIRAGGVHFGIVVQLLVAQLQLEVGRGDALGDGAGAGSV